MILDHFLRREDLTDDQKEIIKREYAALLTEFTGTDKKFRDYTIRSIQKMFSDASFIKRDDYAKISTEDLLVTALTLKAIMIRFRKKGIAPQAQIIKRDNPDWGLDNR